LPPGTNGRLGECLYYLPPTIGAPLAVQYWFLWAHCPSRRTTGEADLRASIAAATRPSPASSRRCRVAAEFGARRVFPRVKLTHVKKLPLVIAGKQKQREIANRAKKILAAKQRDRGANTDGLERQIDRLVDEFYVLTSAEEPLE
jgi:hypothetical protein